MAHKNGGKNGKALIVIAAGGTGGHMFPAQALTRLLVERGWRVALFTDKRGKDFGPDLAEVQTHRLAAAAVLGTGLWRKALAGLQILRGTWQAKHLLRKLGAKAVVGFGGYASVPTVWAAGKLGLKVVIHEQNAVIGRANRLLAPKAGAIATSFASVRGLPETLKERIHLTGNPVRAAIAEVGRRPYAVPGPRDRLTLLVTGGSQGARVFNELVPAAVCRLPDAIKTRLKVVQQVRGSDLQEVAATYKACGVEAELKPFFDDMPQRLAQATLLLCRSGASTVAEIAAAGRPALLVPYPFAADDHQRANAEALCAAGGGWVMHQSELDVARLSAELERLFSQPALLVRAAGAARAFAVDDAARRLADLVEGRLKTDGRSPNGRQGGAGERAA
ncbi:MAG TPA: undecaprenyldiphospho-muramoylpentapeptide beta-N-acetylglucosaminyltransferase [Kiloniellales bacterium]|nr:undecaprenyldiphospho-muramoylpentapeptide beta-N-acetylglucosaminyltransferase [Kiloniellales bacterium]